MWGHYGWLVWLLFGGLFFYLMFRGGGCCGGHGSPGGHGGHGGQGSEGHGDNGGNTPDGTTPRKQAHTGCH